MKSAPSTTGSRELRCEWINDPARLSEIAPSWEQLAADDPCPFTGPLWFTLWWDAFGEGRRLETCALWDGDELAAIFPLYRQGAPLYALANSETPLFRPLAADDDARRRLVDEVTASGAPEILVPMLPTADPAYALLTSGRRSKNVIDPPRQSPIVDTVGTFEDYRAATKDRWHSGIEKKLRRTVREGGEFMLVQSPDDLDAILGPGLELEAAGWKGKAGTAILSRPQTAKFYRELARAFHERGDLQLSWSTYEDRIIAFDLSILRAGRLWGLKGTYDETVSKLSPGLVLRLKVIEHCFEREIDAFELLGVAEEWKTKFATSNRELAQIRSYRSSPAGLARYGYRGYLRPKLRDLYHRLPKRSTS
jgi:CelD/BcsL family acetyltransferase involved in cellulose biosynthesis